MIRMHIVWTDHHRARARLAALANGLDRRALEPLLRAAADEMRADAAALAPARTGALRQSIRAALTVTPAAIGSVTADVGAGARYAPFVEYGTRRRRAHPFLRPALEAAAPRLIGRLLGVIRDSV